MFDDATKAAARADAERWEEMEDAAGLTTSVLVLVQVATTPVPLPLAAAGVMLALAKWKGHVAARIANDPPGDQFAQAVERPVAPLRWRSSDETRTPLEVAVTHLADEWAAAEAFVTAVERMDAAVEGGDEDARGHRETEVIEFGSEVVALLIRSADALRPLVESLQRAGRRTNKTFRREWVVLEAALMEREGPVEYLLERSPDSLLAFFFRLGMTQPDLDFPVQRALARKALVEQTVASPATALAWSLSRTAEGSRGLAAAIARWLETLRPVSQG